MRLVIECAHGRDEAHSLKVPGVVGQTVVFCEPPSITDPEGIRAALAGAGVLDVDTQIVDTGRPDYPDPTWMYRYTTQWMEEK